MLGRQGTRRVGAGARGGRGHMPLRSPEGHLGLRVCVRRRRARRHLALHLLRQHALDRVVRGRGVFLQVLLQGLIFRPFAEEVVRAEALGIRRHGLDLRRRCRRQRPVAQGNWRRLLRRLFRWRGGLAREIQHEATTAGPVGVASVTKHVDMEPGRVVAVGARRRTRPRVVQVQKVHLSGRFARLRLLGSGAEGVPQPRVFPWTVHVVLVLPRRCRRRRRRLLHNARCGPHAGKLRDQVLDEKRGIRRPTGLFLGARLLRLRRGSRALTIAVPRQQHRRL
mmetsp:Transcript_94039/g.270948  ORF Transcript_94039/g.270948 Transcript_94039/m.270948 type:complete len:280 (+) Transcript_94039:766-1605(+)